MDPLKKQSSRISGSIGIIDLLMKTAKNLPGVNLSLRQKSHLMSDQRRSPPWGHDGDCRRKTHADS